MEEKSIVANNQGKAAAPDLVQALMDPMIPPAQFLHRRLLLLRLSTSLSAEALRLVDHRARCTVLLFLDRYRDTRLTWC
jgi:hypothetical protein